MARSPWKASLQTEPTDGQQVWLRLEPFGYSIKAWYHRDTKDYTSLPAHIVVAGAGSGDANGDYFSYGPAGDLYGFAKSDGACFLFFDAVVGNWVLSTSGYGQGGDTLYWVDNHSAVTGPWNTGSGSDPPPAVALALVFPAASNLYWKPYA